MPLQIKCLLPLLVTLVAAADATAGGKPIVVCRGEAPDIVNVVNRMTSLEVSGTTELTGAGGVILNALAIPEDAKLVLDPIATPVKVSAAPTFASGAKIALSADYADVTLGRIVLLTWTGGAIDTTGIFDTSSVAGQASVACATAPDGASKQLVLTVGDYKNDAKEIRILAIGDSITHGYVKNLPNGGQSQQAQYRTAIAARLAANGYKPVMLGHLNRDASNTATTCDAAGVRQPDEWTWHSGVSGNAIATAASYGGVRDNIHLYLDVAGEPDVITLLIGTNDIGGENKSSGEEAYGLYTNLVWKIHSLRPRTRIVGATLLERGSNKGYNGQVLDFNARLLGDVAADGRFPENYACTNLYPLVPQNTDNFFDGLHPTARGFAPVAKGFAAKIMETLPRASFPGPIDEMLTNAPQSALGVAGIAATADGAGLAAYTNGMVHVFTIDSANPKSVMAGSSPYTATVTDMPLGTRLRKAGYFMELVRKGTSRRRWVWVDFSAAGKTLDEIDFPWTGANIDLVVNNLHVLSNDGGVHNIAADVGGVKGVVAGTHFNIGSASKGRAAVPADVTSDHYGWDDTLATSGNYGAFQAHRIFAEGEHWNGAEVLFAWNRWGANDTSKVYDEIGIGDFSYNVSGKSFNYIWTGQAQNGAQKTVAAGAYQVRHFEIWAAPESRDESAWIDEAEYSTLLTGAWKNGVAYGAGGAASIVDNVFVPTAASTGNVVTIDFKMTFGGTELGVEPGDGAQAAARIGKNGSFQVWTGGDWLDVANPAVTPVVDAATEYEFRMTLHYASRKYCVAVLDGVAELPLAAADGTTAFPMAAEGVAVTDVVLRGSTEFRSMLGRCAWLGFASNDVVCVDGDFVLDAKLADWLNALGPYSDVSNRVAALTADGLDRAYLCNLDLTKDGAAADMRFTGISAADGGIEAKVTLDRTGAVQKTGGGDAPINGRVRLYAVELATGVKTLVGEAEVDDATFAKGDTATFTFPTSVPSQCYKAELSH